MLLVLAVAACSPSAEEAPNLAVLIAVDQLIPEHLEAYAPAYEGGFARLLAEGHTFEDAVHAHASTFTGPGHATLATGVVPARHGIVANSWREWDGEEWAGVSAGSDPSTSRVGRGGSGTSPHHLLVDGFGDWLLAAHPEGRVVSLSGKSGAAAFLGGRNRGHVWWFDTAVGGFITSDYHRDAMPPWVERVNEGLVQRVVGDGCWRDELPDEIAALSRRDEVSWEADGTHTAFPHCATDAPYSSEAHFVSRTPALDAAILEMARAAVRELELGRRGVPDYLALALSATDRIGHEFGPFSREQLVNLVQLDRELGAFLDFLDEEVGAGNWTLALSSDHGVIPMPEHLEETGEFGLRVRGGMGGPMRTAAEGLPPTGAELEGPEVAAARRAIAEALAEVEWIERGITLEELAGEDEADSILALYRASFHQERLGARVADFGVEGLPQEGVLVRNSGTTHGQPWLYDRRVPIVFLGARVPAGETRDPARTVDVAPTLAHILGIPVPEGLDGSVLLAR